MLTQIKDFMLDEMIGHLVRISHRPRFVQIQGARYGGVFLYVNYLATKWTGPYAPKAWPRREHGGTPAKRAADRAALVADKNKI
jgi:hypothetical protein